MEQVHESEVSPEEKNYVVPPMSSEVLSRIRQQHFTAEKFRRGMAQSDHGTVSEIADRYSISKSEVRRLRRTGELDAFIEKQS